MCLGEGTPVAPEDNELIGLLLVRAGMIMEDRIGEFISRLPKDHRIVSTRIELLRQTGEQPVALAAAAVIIVDAPVA